MTGQTFIPGRETAAAVQKPSDESPFLVEFFMVESPGYRGMAYCDIIGKWHNAFNHEELAGDVHVLE